MFLRQFEKHYAERHDNSSLCFIRDRNGSVIVDFSLWLDASLRDLDVLREIFTSQKSLTIAGHAVDVTSFRLSGKTNSYSG